MNKVIYLMSKFLTSQKVTASFNEVDHDKL